LIWRPTWGHLRELHAAIKMSSEPLLSGTYSNFSLAQQQEVNYPKQNRCLNSIGSNKITVYGVLQAHVFETGSQCVAFLVNFDPHHMSKVVFRNISLQLAPRSISILSDCNRVVFETSKVTYILL
jgi:hypothetical protein